MVEAIASIITQATNSWQASCGKKPRKYCLPVNRETGYKYHHRANYKSLRARAHLMFTQIIRAISQRVIPALRGVV
jgi:hypothetical protein